jgi:hypothetical protein
MFLAVRASSAVILRVLGVAAQSWEWESSGGFDIDIDIYLVVVHAAEAR